MERSLARTGASATVTPAEEIRDRRIDDLTQVLRATPNVTITDDQRNVAIRGIPASGIARNEDVATLASDNAVTTHLDGVPISTWGGATSTWDIDRIEVFRGPQTTTSGRGALAGAIFLNSAEPTSRWSSHFRAGLGTQQSSALSAAVSGPVVPGVFGLRLSLDRQENVGDIYNTTAGRYQNPDRHVTARAKLVFEPLDGTRITASFTHSDRTRGGGLAVLSEWPDRSISRNNIVERLYKTVDVGSVAFTHPLGGGWRLDGLTGIGRERATRFLDGDVSPADALRVRVDETADQLSQEVRLSYLPAEARFTGFIGAYAGYFRREARNDITGGFNILTLTEQRNRTFAGFSELTIALLPPLRLTLGGRLEADAYDATLQNSLTGRAPVNGSSVVPLPKVSLAYDLTPEATLIGTVQRAYRGGRAGQSLLSGTSYAVDPEYSWTYEAALRTRWLGGRLEVNANVFHTDLRDQQVQRQTGLGSFLDSVLVNAGRSTQEGIELEARFRATESLTTFANAALLRTRFERFVTSTSDFSGNRFPFASPYTVGGGATWRSETGITVSADGNLLGPAYSDAANTRADKLDARFLLNAVTSYDFGPVTLAVFARNILDERYATVRATGSGILAPGLRRFVGVELRGSF